MSSSTAAIDKAIAEGMRLGGAIRERLWPEEYGCDADGACAWIFENIETLEETTRTGWRVPDKGYLRVLAGDWFAGLNGGPPLMVEKSRRLIVSWFCTALELFYSGCRPASVVVGGRAYEGLNGSRQFVWRHWYLYESLRRRFPSWRLPEAYFSGSMDRSELDLFRLANGSVVQAVNAVSESFRGGGASIVRLEELNMQSNAEEIWTQALSITKPPPGHPAGFVYTINNASNSVVWEQMTDRGDVNILVQDADRSSPIKTSPLSNGAKFLQIHYSADPEKDEAWAEDARRGYSTKEWDREFELKRDVYDGEAVFPEFSSEIHVYNGRLPIVPYSRYVSGLDCGSSGLDLAFALLQITPVGQIQCLMEIVPIGKEPMEMFSERVMQVIQRRYPTLYGQVLFVGDPTGRNRSPVGPTAFDVAATKGMTIRPGDNQWHVRHGAVVWALEDWVSDKVPRFVMSAKDCPILKRAMSGAYEWQIKGGQRASFNAGVERLQPKKNAYSHVCISGDALIKTTRGDIAMRDVRVGDYILTRNGYRKCTAAWSNGVRDTVEVTDGTHHVICTRDHEFWTDDGWVPADALRYGSILHVWRETTFKELCRGKLLNLMASGSIATQKAVRGLKRTISRVTKATRHVGSLCIATFGKRRTAQFRRDAIFTISTSTLPTTTSQISNASPQRSIMGNLTNTEPLLAGNVFALHNSWHENGIGATLAESGIVNTHCVLQTQSPSRRRFAKFVGKNTSPKCPSGSVVGPAGPGGGGLQESTTSMPSASSAARNLPKTSTGRVCIARCAVSEVRPSPPVEVFDLTVEGEHEFFANGVLVSNCDALQYAIIVARDMIQGTQTRTINRRAT